jgi:hypothetical protein
MLSHPFRRLHEADSSTSLRMTERMGHGAHCLGWGIRFYLPSGLRKRKRPRVSSGRPWVRARFEAVEIPLNRMKKSRKARKKPLLSPLAIWGRTSWSKAPFTPLIGVADGTVGCNIRKKSLRQRGASDARSRQCARCRQAGCSAASRRVRASLCLNWRPELRGHRRAGDELLPGWDDRLRGAQTR